MKKYSVQFQVMIFESQLTAIVGELHKRKELNPELVKELIYTARQYINRKNKLKKEVNK